MQLLSQRIFMRSQSLALLTSIPPTFSETIRHHAWISLPRFLQLRANVLLISRSKPNANLTNIQTVITLSRNLLPKQISPYAVKVSRHTFVFVSPSVTMAFVKAATANVFRHARKPNYTVVAPLGHGSKANLHLAARGSDRVDTSSAICRTRAALLSVKTIEKNSAFSSSSKLAQLVEERLALQMVTASRSPFLSKLIHAFETPTTLNFATELAPLGDLDRLLSKLPGRRLPEDVAKMIFSEIVLALQDVHNLGLLFRDLKPTNVLFSAGGHVRFSDFGAAKRISVDKRLRKKISCSIDSFSDPDTDVDVLSKNLKFNYSDEYSTIDERTHTFVGTRLYMSPEHLQTEKGTANDGYGRAADVWSLGVVLYIMTTGSHPFATVMDDPETVFSRIYNADITEPVELSDELSELLRGILCKDESLRLDLYGIMSSTWLKGVSWSLVRSYAMDDYPSQPVLDLIHRAGVEGVADIVGTISTDGSEVERMKRLTKELSAWHPRERYQPVARLVKRRETERPKTSEVEGHTVGKRWAQRLLSDGHLPGFGFTAEPPPRPLW